MSTASKESRVCYECGGRMTMRTIEPFEWTVRRGVSYLTPEGLQTWGCDCGEHVLTRESRAEIKQYVDRQIAKDEAEELSEMIETIVDSSGCSRKVVADALGIHYTYLSKIASGRKPVGASLSQLIRVYAGEDQSELQPLLRKFYGSTPAQSERSVFRVNDSLIQSMIESLRMFGVQGNATTSLPDNVVSLDAHRKLQGFDREQADSDERKEWTRLAMGGA